MNVNLLRCLCRDRGFRLGLERAGFKCVGSCEINEYARKVYHKNFGEWPEKDISKVDYLAGSPDMLTAGFPCQDISLAGKGAGLSGSRSGLWYELERIIKINTPRIVFLENVPVLKKRGLPEILGFFASLRYNVEWDCISASVFGAKHLRDRIWIVAYTRSKGRQQKSRSAHADESSNERRSKKENHQLKCNVQKGIWETFDSSICRMVNGVPHRMDRLRCLGNAVVPQIVEWIGRRILEVESLK